MENLAPAGNREALERADAAGADAVYLGYAAFSARAGAGNFDRQELEDAMHYAHARHMRVYVTLNTLVKDRELPAVAEVIRLLREIRADGVLVQDAGILRMRSITGQARRGAWPRECAGWYWHGNAPWMRSAGARRPELRSKCSATGPSASP